MRLAEYSKGAGSPNFWFHSGLFLKLEAAFHLVTQEQQHYTIIF